MLETWVSNDIVCCLKFDRSSDNTPIPISAGNVNASALLLDMAADREKMEKDNPLMDAVRRWVAPYNGKISISGDVQLHDFTTDPTLSDAERDRRRKYETADGVRVSIQHGNDEIWAAPIGPNDYAPKSPAQTYEEGVPALT